MSIKYIIREIKFGFQRMFRGYSDDIKWEFDSYFSQFIQPLKEFCEAELKEKDIMALNEKRDKIFKETLMYIEDYQKMDYLDSYKEENEETRLWKYFGEHIGYYWN